MQAQTFLVRLRGRIQRVVLASGVGRLLGGCIFVLLVLIVLDRYEPLPGVVRLLILISGLGLLAWQIWQRLLRPMRRDWSLATLARIAEGRLPEADGRFFSAIDGLTLAPRDQTELERICTPDSLRRIVRTDGMRGMLAFAGLGLLLLGLLTALSPSFMQTGLSRIFMPLGEARWPLARELAVALRSPIVASDQPLVVEVERRRGSAAPIEITWQRQDGVREQIIPDGIVGPWSETLSLAPGEYQVRIQTKDAAPVQVSARVVARPSLSDVVVEVVPPAYAGIAPFLVENPTELSSLAGTQMHYRFKLRDSPAEARSLSATLGTQPLAIDDGPDGSHLQFQLQQDSILRLELTDSYKSPTGATVEIPARPAPRLSLTAQPDAAPVVGIDGLRNNEQVTPQGRFQISLHAVDAIGLAELALEQAVLASDAAIDPDALGTQLQELAQWRDQIRGLRDVSQQHEVLIGSLAGQGKRLVLRGRASDANDVSGPGVGYSELISVLVVSQEELRQELDRDLAEIRDRLSQSRDHLAAGIAAPEKLIDAARSARALARRGGEQLAVVVRRWTANQLDEEIANKLGRGSLRVNADALPPLEALADGASEDAEQSGEQARTADDAIGEVEAMLTQMLRSGDLARQLHSLLGRQQALSRQTREVVKEQLGKREDEAAATLRRDLGVRQRELSSRLKDWERRLQSTDSEHFEKARNTVREQQPAGLLAGAASRLDNSGEMTQAPAAQQGAEAVMQQLLKELRGGEAMQELAERAARLAQQQTELKERAEAGEPPASLQDEQDKLQQETERLTRDLKEAASESEAGPSLQAAAAAQGQASQAMGKGQSQAAASAAGSAAAMLARAAEQLEKEAGKQGDKQQDEDKDEKEKDQIDVLGLLRSLLAEQRRINGMAAVQHGDLKAAHLQGGGRGDYQAEDLNFGAKRKLGDTADLQEEALLRLRQEGLEHLGEMPVAKRSLQRVDAAMEKAHSHLARPALGERGVQLIGRALYELERLIEIVDTMPPLQPNDEKGGGGGSGGAEPPPFPPRAQLALLKAEQETLSWWTATSHPADLKALQAELLDLAKHVAATTRPGTRPALLMQRITRAMASATDLLAHDERGATTRDEQDAATALLHRLMAEQKQGSCEAQSKNKQSQPRNNGQPQNQPGQSRASGTDSGSSQPGQAQQSPGDAGNGAPERGSALQSGAGESGTDLQAGGASTWVPLLPQRQQDAVLQGGRDNVPAEGIQLYREYLLKLQESD